MQQNKPKTEGGILCSSCRRWMPIHSFMSRLKTVLCGGRSDTHGLNPVLRFTENWKELAHVKALSLRVTGNLLMGYADTGGRCALPLP